jgi:hypothetical protein
MTLDDLLAMNRFGSLADMAGQAVGAAGQYLAGRDARTSGGLTAEQLRQNAGQSQASAQRDAIDIDRQTQLITSAALATAAASGGGASDPDVVNLIARNAAEGAYRKSVALYQGDDKARMGRMAADVAEYEGKVAETNSNLRAGASLFGATTTLMKGQERGSSLYSRFGNGGPRNKWGME